MAEIAETIATICGLSILGAITIIVIIMTIIFIKDFINNEL